MSNTLERVQELSRAVNAMSQQMEQMGQVINAHADIINRQGAVIEQHDNAIGNIMRWLESELGEDAVERLQVQLGMVERPETGSQSIIVGSGDEA